MTEHTKHRVLVLGIIQRQGVDHAGPRKPLPVQLDWLPENIGAKLEGKCITVRRPDGGEAEFRIAEVEQHCGLKLIYLEGATAEDVFPGCFVQF